MADKIELSDCLVPYEWKKQQDAYEREHGAEKKPEIVPLPYPAPEHPRLPLVEAEKLAREAGMTYGQYMAQRGIFPPPPRRRKRQLSWTYSQLFVKPCEKCGKPLPDKQRKYCHDCKAAAYKKNAIERGWMEEAAGGTL